MKALSLTIPGECPIKKNNAKHQSFRWDKKRNLKIPLPYNVVYYTDKYKEWVRSSISHLYKFKQEHPEIKFPLQGSYFIAFWVFRSRNDVLGETKSRIDLTNIIEAPQDLLSGNAGNFLDSGKKKFDHSLYQVFADDNARIITCLSTSRVFYDPVNPRIQIFIRPFDEDIFLQSHYLIFGKE